MYATTIGNSVENMCEAPVSSPSFSSVQWQFTIWGCGIEQYFSETVVSWNPGYSQKTIEIKRKYWPVDPWALCNKSVAALNTQLATFIAFFLAWYSAKALLFCSWFSPSCGALQEERCPHRATIVRVLGWKSNYWHSRGLFIYHKHVGTKCLVSGVGYKWWLLQWTVLYTAG